MIERFQDLDTLLSANRKIRDQFIQINIQSISFREFNDLSAAGFTVDKDPLGMFFTKDDIFKNSHRLDQHKMLMDHPDPQTSGMIRRFNVNFFAFEEYLSVCRLIKSDQYVHQRGLTGAVFTQQCMDLTVFYG